MAFFFASKTNRRTANEDSFCQMEIRMNDEAAVYAMAVADGMGGLSAGKYYSETAVNLWFEELIRVMMDSSFRGNPLEHQIEMLTEFSEKIYEKLGQKLYKKGLDAGVKGGTTLSGVIHFWDTIIVSNCGDSPVYGIRDGKLVLFSEIQNVAERMVKEGKTSPGSLLYCQNKNRLLNYLGKKGGSRPYCKVIPDEGIDALIIGSDGAFGSLSVAEIAQCFLSEKKPQDMIRRLLDKAREKGEEDNQTVILYIPGTNKREKKSETENTEKLREEKQETECCYTSLEEKKTGFLRDKFRKNRFTGGR